MCYKREFTQKPFNVKSTNKFGFHIILYENMSINKPYLNDKNWQGPFGLKL